MKKVCIMPVFEGLWNKSIAKLNKIKTHWKRILININFSFYYLLK
jgi:hypothetical protein